ncbi:MAG: hypothetical protein AMXMBFR82_25780 [Candidatus Hydrogenedentota bacterium]
MPDSVNRALRFSTVCLVLLSYLALTSVSSFGGEVVLVGIVILAIAPLLEAVDRGTPLFRRITSLFTLVFALVILPQMVMKVGVLIALTILCLYIQAYLLIHDRSIRDYQYIFLMAFFLMVSACAQNPEPSLGLVIPFFMIAIVWCFGMLQIRKDVTGHADVSVGMLLTPSTNERLVPTEGMSRLQEPRIIGGALSSFLVLTAVCCFLLSLAIFALTPRMEVGMLGGSSLAVSAPDVTDSVDLARGGRIGSSGTPVMRVRFPEEPDGIYDGELLWRVTTLNEYVGTRWGRTRIDEADFADRQRRERNGDVEQTGRRQSNQYRVVQQEIYLDDPPPTGVPCLALPRDAEPTDQGGGRLDIDVSGDYTVYSRQRRRVALSYEVTSVVPVAEPEQLREYPEHFASLRGQRGFPFFYERVMGLRAYETFTQEELSDPARELARAITDPYDNPYDQAEAIVRWFQEEDFVYSLTVPEADGVDPIDQFLLETRTGHCELYASAMTLMLRSIGIPARVVSGYRGGEWSDADGAYIVRKSMAHMWVEVYFINYGWTTFDPTPESDLPELEIGAFSRLVSRQILNLKMMWFRDVVGYTGGIHIGDIGRFTLGLLWFDFDAINTTILNRPILSGVVPRIVFWGTILIALALGVIALVSRRPRRRVAHVIFSPDQMRATRLYGKMKRRLTRMGVDCSGKTAGEVFAALNGDFLAYEKPVGEIIRAYREARFGGRPMDRHRYAALSRALDALDRKADPST